MALKLSRNALAASAVALALSPVATPTALAQSQSQSQSQNYQDSAPPSGYSGSYSDDQNRDVPPPPPRNAPDNSYQSGQYRGGPDSQYRDGGPPSGYADDVPPPNGYDGTRPPPPPPGYQSSADDAAQRDRDDRYAYDAERWARDNCVKSRGNTGAGAVIGGIFGAIIGNGLSGRHDHGAGTLAGAAVGAVGGAAIASSAGGNETSPGCPPGYVVRGGAPAYSYDADYAYAAPGWYRPWVFVGNNWTYRPYPYHRWYYRTYRQYPHRGDHRGYGRYRRY